MRKAILIFFILIFSLLPASSLKASSCVPKTLKPFGGWLFSQANTTAGIGESLCKRAEEIFANARIVSYKHQKNIPKYLVRCLENEGYEINTDCSGFIGYLLDSISPKHYEALRKRQSYGSYPLSKTYAEFFSGLDAQIPTEGWLKVANIRELKKGDIIAWKKTRRTKGKYRPCHDGYSDAFRNKEGKGQRP